MNIEPLLQWLTVHPQWAGLLVFMIALVESLAIVGLLVPGVAMMFAAGALIGNGTLLFGPTCMWAVAGAVVGDGLSFWLGYRYDRQLRNLKPLRKHADMLVRGEQFFVRYGGFSVFLGRFFGPVRAVIPLVAGMLKMPASRFLIYNILSALVWAPVYLLPGMAFGASLELAGRVAGRLMVMLVILALTVWLLVLLTRLVYRYCRPHTAALIGWYLDWSHNHALLETISRPLIMRERGAVVSLLLLALVLGGGVAVLAQIVPAGETGPEDLGLAIADLWVSQLLLVFSGNWLLLPGMLVALALLATAPGTSLRYWLLVMLVCLAGGGLLSLAGAEDAVTRAVLFWGGLAFLLADTSLHQRWAMVGYSMASSIVGAVVLGRLYQGGLNLSLLLSAVLLPTFWLLAAGTAYHRHRLQPLPAKALPAAIMAGLAGLLVAMLSVDLVQTVKTPLLKAMPGSEWSQAGWRELPGYREAILDSSQQRLNVQWNGTLEEMDAFFADRGWQPAVALRLRSALYWLNMTAALEQLPLLPRPLNGNSEARVWIKPVGNGRQSLVFRIWPSGYQLSPGNCPLWLGRLALLEKAVIANLWVFLDEVDAGLVPLERLETSLQDAGVVIAGAAPGLLLAQSKACGDSFSGDGSRKNHVESSGQIGKNSGNLR